MSAPETASNRFGRFMERGGWWRAVLFTAVYLALYVGAGLLVETLFGDAIGDDPFGDATTLFLAMALPLLVGSALLLAAVAALRWFGPLFGRQPVRGRAWMWIAPVVVVLAAAARAAGTDYEQYSGGVIALTYATGLLIGFTEEILARGIVIGMLRRAGRSEPAVMLLSSLLFALMHATNIVSGQALGTVLATMGFAFVFGVAMYLTLRVTGFLVWPMLLHAVTDPSTFLATGGVDEVAAGGTSPLVTLAGASVVLYALLAVAALFLVRGRAETGGLMREPGLLPLGAAGSGCSPRLPIGGNQATGPRRSVNVAVGPSGPAVARAMNGSVPSVTVSWPRWPFMSVAANLRLATSPGVTTLNLMPGSACAYRTVIMFSAAFEEL
ncbi:type II CAAX endopeptidase family protein [Glycomyces tritici]|uniref:Type II CAAX endopeptidase family protein n=1 Tax=Glycomyces tritici TaxID=2665176 RepID=A0ABT7YS13_9ACTN|nr:type II CAAX endopeptidase family protein [Glycomyces tritici]MDN3241053.1 type II CAAX endopeptidase family protein [Glycomyces tritici]